MAAGRESLRSEADPSSQVTFWSWPYLMPCTHIGNCTARWPAEITLASAGQTSSEVTLTYHGAARRS